MGCRWRSAVFLLVPGGALLCWGEVQIDPAAFNPSGRCGGCHVEIYAKWKKSMHAASFTDPIFASSYMQAYLETRGEAKDVCLRCHAPIAALTGDLDMARDVSREGVTCDFCHSVHAVDLARPGDPFEVRLDGAKRGPLTGAVSPSHGVVKSELHATAEFCAGCHEYTNPGGVPVLSTYTEWKASPQAAEGKTCQHCHMPLTAGTTVREGLGVRRTSINLHDISGMHSTEQVRKAATARILAVVERQPGVAVVDVEVANVGSGHSIPTGLPTRKLVLQVRLFAGGDLVRTFERVYQKELLDADNRAIAEDHRTMLAAAGVREDTRLRPGERRRERFVADVPEKVRLRAEMQLRYSYEPVLLSRQSMSIEIASARHP